MAESEGFEPPDLLQSTVFKTAAFDHSANSPVYIFGLYLYRIILMVFAAYLIRADSQQSGGL